MLEIEVAVRPTTQIGLVASVQKYFLEFVKLSQLVYYVNIFLRYDPFPILTQTYTECLNAS